MNVRFIHQAVRGAQFCKGLRALFLFQSCGCTGAKWLATSRSRTA